MISCVESGCGRTINLLYFPEPRCGRHITPEQRALLDELDRRARAVGIRDGGWPYGPNIHVDTRAALLDWAEPQQLQYSTRGNCLHWIARGRCAVSLCREERGHHSWMDHVTGWTHGGKPAVLVSQPYHLTAAERVELQRIGMEWTLDVRIGEPGSGWYELGTWMVELRPRAQSQSARGTA